jgi:methylthioribulose-1-phosphate dehydratase
VSDARRNPFPQPTALEKVFLKELVTVAKACYDRGWSHGTAGNFSLRGQAGIVWQSPSGLNKGALNPAHFIAVDLATAAPISPQSARPSQEMPVHLGIYRAVPEAMAVVHTHPPALVERSRSGKDLVFQGEEMQKHLGCHDHLETLRIPVLVNPTPEQMPALADGVAPYIRVKVPMVVLATHGVYAWGRSPMEALSYAEAAEFLCKSNKLNS